ncbi:SDR family NAD(P)-dependent oxidoreductase [Nocardia macrotermitis]|uniref:Glucose 1-dehydrogenase n=1 Tax=Nocardia macrotermitis TaxID=2585198 RepID=A0A7K0DBA2_9NOCA|nr:SDR family oxidoreductase [Nocardia macrotermitis]MQY23076.1 Glucose 1-dehydrogenase [Nocardia macrotermitis]
MGQLDGRTAVVTGGSSGIGRAAAERFAAEGAHVFVTGRRVDELNATVETLGSATAVPGDIANPADLDRLYEAVAARGKGLDTLFANAGTGAFATLEQTTREHFDTIFETNVWGTLQTVRKALPLLNDGATVIVNTSVRADDGMAAFGAYAASKAALRSFTRTWASELEGRGIRVNAIAPGTIDTAALAAIGGPQDAAAVRAGFAANVPIGRIGTPAEVAGAVMFLASADSSFVVGSNLYIDGGEMQL